MSALAETAYLSVKIPSSKRMRLKREEVLCKTLLEAEGWGHVAGAYASALPFPPSIQKFYHQFWTESGFNIRRQVNDDAILVKMLRNMLPPYSGGPVKLYRGEGGRDWQNGKVGLCWTTDFECAELFASGSNCDEGFGGILLECHAPTDAIIAGPSPHSIHLKETEFTVDPGLLSDVTALQRISWHSDRNTKIVVNLA